MTDTRHPPGDSLLKRREDALRNICRIASTEDDWAQHPADAPWLVKNRIEDLAKACAERDRYRETLEEIREECGKGHVRDAPLARWVERIANRALKGGRQCS